MKNMLIKNAADARRKKGKLQGISPLFFTLYQIVGVSGEYLTLFLEEINSRSSGLLVQLDESVDAYEDLESFKVLSDNRQPLPPIFSLVHKDLLLSIESLQKRILDIYCSMLELEDLIHIMNIVDEELLGEKLLLQQILSGNVSSVEHYQQIIELHASESLTLSNLKDDLDYYLLSWTFEIGSVLIEGRFLNYATETYLKLCP
jgi:hypothetical protein